jgi:hypothetical protein
MKVIRHCDRSDGVPIFVCAAKRLDCLKRCRICKNESAILDAERNEVSDDLIISKPD